MEEVGSRPPPALNPKKLRPPIPIPFHKLQATSDLVEANELWQRNRDQGANRD